LVVIINLRGFGAILIGSDNHPKRHRLDHLTYVEPCALDLDLESSSWSDHISDVCSLIAVVISSEGTTVLPPRQDWTHVTLSYIFVIVEPVQ
jgi:hypothetical protein